MEEVTMQEAHEDIGDLYRTSLNRLAPHLRCPKVMYMAPSSLADPEAGASDLW